MLFEELEATLISDLEVAGLTVRRDPLDRRFLLTVRYLDVLLQAADDPELQERGRPDFLLFTSPRKSCDYLNDRILWTTLMKHMSVKLRGGTIISRLKVSPTRYWM